MYDGRSGKVLVRVVSLLKRPRQARRSQFAASWKNGATNRLSCWRSGA